MSNAFPSSEPEIEDDEVPLVGRPVDQSVDLSTDSDTDQPINNKQPISEKALKFTALAIIAALFVIAFVFYHLTQSINQSVIPTTVQLDDRITAPDWVIRYNVSHLFDWTYQLNGDKARVDAHLAANPNPKAPEPIDYLRHSIVRNDMLEHFSARPSEGVIVDDIEQLHNPTPHQLPISKDWKSTCKSLNIMRWPMCRLSQSDLNEWLPATKRVIVSAVFDASVDVGTCHDVVPGTVFTPQSTYHPQRKTNNRCFNNSIEYLPAADHVHHQLITTVGAYLNAPGHWAPQQLPKLLRMLATCPPDAKVLVAKGGTADGLTDVLVARGVLKRDRIVRWDGSRHFASVVYSADPWPYVTDKFDHYSYSRSDVQLVRSAIADPLDDEHRDLVIVIDRGHGHDRALKEHEKLVEVIKTYVSDANLDLTVHSFDARGPVSQHIELFRRARVIIGPHGAGLMNLYWSKAGTHTVEIGYNTGMMLPEMYAEMALHLDHKYYLCKGIGDYFGEMDVDWPDMNWILEQIITDLKQEMKK